MVKRFLMLEALALLAIAANWWFFMAHTLAGFATSLVMGGVLLLVLSCGTNFGSSVFLRDQRFSDERSNNSAQIEGRFQQERKSEAKNIPDVALLLLVGASLLIVGTLLHRVI